MRFMINQYQVAQLFTVANLSKLETGGGDGVEVLKNEPFTGKPLFYGQYPEGQYTKKLYIGKKKVNGVVRTILPATALIGIEEAWNAYPYCRTIIKNEFMGDDFNLTVESMHCPGRGELENVHRLPPDQLAEREVVWIDIAAELADSKDYNPKEDPAKFKSKKTGRGSLKPGWTKTVQPSMTCYKLVSAKFKWFGLQKIVEGKMHKGIRRMFTLFHRQLFCLMDEWHGLTIENIREIENKTKDELRSLQQQAETRGMNLDS
ncbi:Phosphatidylinositol transfer protein alpha isoform [Orchesella cincta]|uniref:Phosphatidylinositol transfer protein alpha isoform n=1 Tax=Orchesella cincta TaxID=48709 RepID=A0A1D2N6N8_ORCCI|nr:Phosphatidylinositol transfer protein alpha isoform [Orchesella cincta]